MRSHSHSSFMITLWQKLPHVIPRIALVLSPPPPLLLLGWEETYQKLSRSSFANIMSSRALEIVRVLCMHMGDIIFFIAYAWPTRGDTPPRSTPPAVPLDLCVILHDSPKKKNERTKKWKSAVIFGHYQAAVPRLSLATKHGIQHGTQTSM